MADRLTRWEGLSEDGSRKAVLIKHDGPFPDLFQEALKKLCRFEDAEEQGFLRLPEQTEEALIRENRDLRTMHHLDLAEIVRLRRQIQALMEEKNEL